MRNINFIRHGDHNPIDGEVLYGGLSNLGRQEARSIAYKLDLRNDKATVYTVDNARSMGTVAIALDPKIKDSAIDKTVKSLLSNHTITVDGQLNYNSQEADEYITDLNEAFFAARALRFFAEKSDEYHDDKHSTYSSMATTIAKYVESSVDPSRNVLILAREFFYPSFRAKLIELKHGIKKRDYYADWYGDNIEWNPEARTDVSRVSLNLSSHRYVLSDKYGEEEFNSDNLETIIRGV